MPYKNIRWTKLMFWELMTDSENKFIERLSDEQKGLFLMLFLLMGYYKNQIPNDPETIKRVLNLSEKPEKIGENVTKICEVFNNGIKRGKYIKFRDYNKLHNPVGNSQGYSEGTPKGGAEESRVEVEKKENIDKILGEYLSLQKIDAKDNAALMHDLYVRNCRPIKKLLSICKTPGEASSAIKWVAGWLEPKGLSWTLETVIKHYTTYLKETAGKTGIDKWRVYK